MADDDVSEVPAPEEAQAQAQFNVPMKLGFGYINPAGFAFPAPVDTTQQQRWYHISRCVDVLKEAAQIRRDDALMKEIREWVRQQRDQMGVLLDEIG